jgi:hypothetical protein
MPDNPIPRPPHDRRRSDLRVPPWAQLVGAASLLLAAAAVADGDLARPAQAQIAVQNQGYIPFSEPPINYRTRELTDPVTLLQKRLEAGTAELVYEPGHGYLRSALQLLDIPVDSQTLVFSKTSFQHRLISPEHPRALYYNDDVYIGAVHEGNAIEVISFDPMQGAIFFVLDEHRVDKPAFQRAELDCTQCHIAAGTRGVPGVFLRSVVPTSTGTVAPRTTMLISDQNSPLKDRWGGWYASGAFGGATMANAVASAEAIATSDAAAPAAPRLSTLVQPFDPSAYLAPTSDQVALLVLAHQTQMHNLITLTNYQTRLALHAAARETGASLDAAVALEALPEAARQQITRPAEQLLRYLLFASEASLGGADSRRIIASSAFAREFAARGVRDSRRRSLRDFDLHDRTFRYPCSYLIYSSAFDALPEPAKGYVYHRLLEILTGQDQSADFARLTEQDRKDILSILLETKPGLPPEWRDYARANRIRLASSLSPRAPSN